MASILRQRKVLHGFLNNHRCFSTNSILNAINKQQLTTLRKKTGYSFTKCNEAMKLYENDMEKAEIWLHQQAEKEGWAKAKKLQSRSTSEGLVGVLTEQNYIALVEVACETDFVARNELFTELVGSTAQSVLKFRQKVIEQNMKVSSNQEITHLREMVLEHDLKEMKHPSLDVTLEEHLVQLVGKIGENMKIKRALAMTTNQENIIGVSTHGGNNTVTSNGSLLGKFAGVVVLKPKTTDVDVENLKKIARDLSQHVIGMNPIALQPSNDVSKEESLLGQEFLLNDKVTVAELLNQNQADVVDFIRYGLTS
ncbi:elongation factor Ts, mitochondrial-like [Clytia hemisphaerica]|uniref:Elongation factor Ts, mitochondrial n=1 Tax=Clytia hemisphaerica TaxID=252671 RepID=A0A7M5X8G2_9CNID